MNSNNNLPNCMACSNFFLGSRPYPYRCRAWNMKSHIYDLAGEVYKSIHQPCPYFQPKKENEKNTPQDSENKKTFKNGKFDYYV